MGMIFDIQRCSLNDGPGIRTTRILQGMTATLSLVPQSGVRQRGGRSFPMTRIGASCAGDARSAQTASTALTAATGWTFDGASRAVAAPRSATPGRSKSMARSMGAEEILDIAERDRAYYEASGGGITLSGGEPMAQLDFALKILEGARQRGIGNGDGNQRLCHRPEISVASCPMWTGFSTTTRRRRRCTVH